MWLDDWMRHTYIKIKKNEKNTNEKNLLIIYDISANFKEEEEGEKNNQWTKQEKNTSIENH